MENDEIQHSLAFTFSGAQNHFYAPVRVFKGLTDRDSPGDFQPVSPIRSRGARRRACPGQTSAEHLLGQIFTLGRTLAPGRR